MNRSRWILLVVLLAIVVGGGWWLRSRGRAPAPSYRTAAVERGSLKATVSATGSVRPVTQVSVGSQVSGTLAKLNVDYNSRVRAGEVLAQLDPASFRARAAQADAAVARAEAAAKDARRQYKRAQELVKDDFISQADVDAAEVAVEQRDADLMQARAQLDVAKVDLANTTIRSPIDGVVIARSVDVGQTVAASLQAPQLFLIANDLAQMQVETRIDEADIGRIHPGQLVTFSVDAFPDATFEGRVSQVRLEPITDQNVVTYTTVIHTRNDDLRLRPGMTANVSVLVDSREDVLKLPNAALRFRPAANGPAGASRPGQNTAAGGQRGNNSPTRENPAGAALAATAPARATATASGGSGGPSRRGAPGEGSGAAAARDPGAGPGSPLQRGAPAEGSGTAAGARGPREHRAAPAGPGAHRSSQLRNPADAEQTDLKPGTVYVLKQGKPMAIRLLTGITDGSMTEIVTTELKPGDLVVVGLDGSSARATTGLQPPPGMGGPQFRGPGGRR